MNNESKNQNNIIDIQDIKTQNINILKNHNFSDNFISGSCAQYAGIAKNAINT